MRTGKWSKCAALVARWFGVTRADFSRSMSAAAPPAAIGRMALLAGQVVLVTGASGAGKSVLLRRMRRRAHRGRNDLRWIDLEEIRFRDLPVIDIVVDALDAG